MENAIEWTKCLFSPKYARTTYLRITPKHEKELLEFWTKVVIVIAIAAALMGMFAAYRYGQYVMLKRIIESNQPVQVEPTTINVEEA